MRGSQSAGPAIPRGGCPFLPLGLTEQNHSPTFPGSPNRLVFVLRGTPMTLNSRAARGTLERPDHGLLRLRPDRAVAALRQPRPTRRPAPTAASWAPGHLPRRRFDRAHRRPQADLRAGPQDQGRSGRQRRAGPGSSLPHGIPAMPTGLPVGRPGSPPIPPSIHRTGGANLPRAIERDGRVAVDPGAPGVCRAVASRSAHADARSLADELWVERIAELDDERRVGG